MAALSPKAREVIQAGRAGLRPVVGDRERIEALLTARLGPSAPNPGGGSVRAFGWRVIAPVTLGIALVGGGALLALRRHAPAPPANVPTVSAPAAANITAQDPSPTVVADPVPPEAASVTPTSAPKPTLAPPASAPRAQDRLAQEVMLLSRATSDLRAGRAADALQALDETPTRIPPNGVLSVETPRGASPSALLIEARHRRPCRARAPGPAIPCRSARRASLRRGLHGKVAIGSPTLVARSKRTAPGR